MSFGDLTLPFILAIFAIGFAGSFISGLVGIGGAIVNYPMLLYIPPMLGFAAFTAHEVAGISAVQVIFATIGGVWAYRNSGYLNKKLIITMGIAVIAGSFLGGFGSSGMSELAVNVVYGILAVIAAVLMFIPQKKSEEKTDGEVEFSVPIAAVLAFIVGVSAGIVGAGGSFLLVPIMLTVLRIPARTTIATSLAVTFISSIGSTAGKVFTGQVLLWPAVILTIASLIASPLGAKVGQKINTNMLKWILAVLIAATALNIWRTLIMEWI
ncbi:sulfite exporter TauE/SafE family protein [Bhargavaea cecembensis]|uniref:sulfite exporter TauE/SafE family protein n=1 Tax=Bhargavaea cecembensis TaxID=394098 RepID=UPI00211D6501|nr:sulfite exporter TauE/SafE family protein [Bhargavaea cecembensis]